MVYKRYPDVSDDTLVINRYESVCGGCSGDADPHATSHDKIIGYTPAVGCGITWTKVTSAYIDESLKKSIVSMRPDLEWVDMVFDLPVAPDDTQGVAD